MNADEPTSHTPSPRPSPGVPGEGANWFIYALGGGLGHLTRSLALARRAARYGATVRIISNSRFAAILAARQCRQLVTLEPGIELLPLPSDNDKATVTRAAVAAIRDAGTPEVFVVDTFPRGLAGELVELLPSLRALRVFVHRDLNPNYVRWAELETCAVRYDLLLVPGEDAPLAHLPHARRTPPWLVCDADELLSRDESRNILGISPENHLPLCVVMGSGTPEESLAAAHAAHTLAKNFARQTVVRFVSCDAAALTVAGKLGRSLWPLLAALRGVDLLIGGGGYNTVHEARATATPLIALAHPRLYDRQSLRLRPEELATDWRHASELVAAHLNQQTLAVSKSAPTFDNGAEAAFRIIAEAAKSR